MTPPPPPNPPPPPPLAHLHQNVEENESNPYPGDSDLPGLPPRTSIRLATLGQETTTKITHGHVALLAHVPTGNLVVAPDLANDRGRPHHASKAKLTESMSPKWPTL